MCIEFPGGQDVRQDERKNSGKERYGNGQNVHNAEAQSDGKNTKCQPDFSRLAQF